MDISKILFEQFDSNNVAKLIAAATKNDAEEVSAAKESTLSSQIKELFDSVDEEAGIPDVKNDALMEKE